LARGGWRAGGCDGQRARSRLTGSGARAPTSPQQQTTVASRPSSDDDGEQVEHVPKCDPPTPRLTVNRWAWAGVHWDVKECTGAPHPRVSGMMMWLGESPGTAARQAHALPSSRPRGGRRPQHVCPPDPPRAASRMFACGFRRKAEAFMIWPRLTTIPLSNG
jgi:hypothetical protein